MMIITSTTTAAESMQSADLIRSDVIIIYLPCVDSKIRTSEIPDLFHYYPFVLLKPNKRMLHFWCIISSHQKFLKICTLSTKRKFSNNSSQFFGNAMESFINWLIYHHITIFNFAFLFHSILFSGSMLFIIMIIIN